MRLSSILIAVIVILFFILFGDYRNNYVEPQIENIEPVEVIEPVEPMNTELYNLANSERLQRMNWNTCLAERAEERAKQIVDTDYWSHQDKSGEYPYMELVDSCINYKNAGENLTADFTNAEDAHEALMNSPTHKANIVGDYTDMGVGCFDTICVQLFAK